MLGVALVGMAAVLAVVVAGLGAATAARHRADNAADLAALAAARAVRVSAEGAVGPCAEAARVAVANGAELRECEIEGREALVRVRVRVGHGGTLGSAVAAEGRARAGPLP